MLLPLATAGSGGGHSSLGSGTWVVVGGVALSCSKWSQVQAVGVVFPLATGE